MQYIFHDLIKLPLNERLIIIERAISTFCDEEMEEQLLRSIKEKIKELSMVMNPVNS